MSADQLPFYAQTAVLDEYIHTDNPREDRVALEIILKALETRQDLREYFFRAGPNAAWAQVLWEEGFLNSPPKPERTEEGYVLPRWDVQGFVISVASQVPDIVVEHIRTIDAHPIYIARSVSALLSIPPEKISQVVPRIVQWLAEPAIAQRIASDTFELIKRLVEYNDHDSALSLFRALTEPLPPSEESAAGFAVLRTDALSKYRTHYDGDPIGESVGQLSSGDFMVEAVGILEEHLCQALELEAEAADNNANKFASWWRSAIEETDQDRFKSHKDHLLEALRDGLEKLAHESTGFVEAQIRRFLHDKHEIMRRLGIHMLAEFPDLFPALVSSVLTEETNLNSVGIHHEMFRLLQNGFSTLQNDEQQELVEAIREGPPSEYVAQLAERAEEHYQEDPKQYTRGFVKTWIRDRLLMIEKHLEPLDMQLLEDLIAEYGKPEHPSFTTWMGNFHAVQEIGPLPVDELTRLTPTELVEFIREWKPDEDRFFGPEEISYQGLARDVISLITAHPSRYQDDLSSIAACRPEIADSLLRHLADHQQSLIFSWEVILEFIEQLLTDDYVRGRTDASSGRSWASVRRAMVQLLQTGLNNPERSIPFELLERVKAILFVLVDDPDPSPEREHPQKGSLGHNDPFSMAINSVRPRALIALIEYAYHRQQVITAAEPEATPKLSTLEADVERVLTRKLDRTEDPSWSLHSVYGRFLPLLHWLNPRWIELHLEQILPDSSEESAMQFFVAAWDTYVTFNHFYLPLYGSLRPKYERAILNLKEGLTTHSHLEPAKRLAMHIGQEYLSADYDIHSPVGQRSLVVMFLEQAPPEVRSHLAWWLWRACREVDEERLTDLWPRIRSLWEWRMQKAAVADHSNTFDREMEWLAYLPDVAPDSESIESMWPLLTALIPHVVRSENQDMGWRALEDYLAVEVKRHPVKVVRFYRLMYESKPKMRWFHNRSEVRDIIEIASQNPGARQDILDLVDLMARQHGIYQYRYIYDELT